MQNIEKEGVDVPLRIIQILDEGASLPNLNPNKQDCMGGNLSSVYRHLYGYCNWDITAKFGESKRYQRVHILDDNSNPETIKVLKKDAPNGVLHQITFYV
jgi:hypothetical protein